MAKLPEKMNVEFALAALMYLADQENEPERYRRWYLEAYDDMKRWFDETYGKEFEDITKEVDHLIKKKPYGT